MLRKEPVIFEDVQLKKEEILNFYESNVNNQFHTIRTHIAQTILINVLLGIAEGAFEELKNYVKSKTRPWLSSKVDSAEYDPYILHKYGNLYVQLKAAAALSEKAAVAVQEIWNQGKDITELERGSCGITVATAKVAVAKAALEVSNGIFEVMGARSTSGKYGYGRYWRNIRTHTLHDPLDYKIRDIGNWTLNNRLPEITPYS